MVNALPFVLTVASRFTVDGVQVTSQADTTTAVGSGLLRNFTVSGPMGTFSFWVKLVIDENSPYARAWRLIVQNTSNRPVTVDIDLSLAKSFEWNSGPVRLVDYGPTGTKVTARNTCRNGSAKNDKAIQAGAGSIRDIVRFTLEPLQSGEAVARIVPRPASDLDGDGDVDAADQGILLGAWAEESHVGDVNLDGLVDHRDLATLLAEWSIA